MSLDEEEEVFVVRLVEMKVRFWIWDFHVFETKA